MLITGSPGPRRRSAGATEGMASIRPQPLLCVSTTPASDLHCLLPGLLSQLPTWLLCSLSITSQRPGDPHF